MMGRKILFIVGSLRERSFNRQLATVAAGLLEKEAEVEWLDFGDVPLMSQDIEFPPPPGVARVREAVQEADGVWIFSPEYNHSIPGLLKNLLDWLSRPLSPDYAVPSALRGKPVTYSSCAGSSGGRYMMADLGEVLGVPGCVLADTVTTGIKLDRQAFTTDVLALSDDDLQVLSAQARMFLDSLEGAPASA